MKSIKKFVSVLCVVTMLIGVMSCVAFAADEGIDYAITSTYADVDWSWKQYKTDLHSHTTASDGDYSMKDMLEKQYDYGFDIVAISDHGLSSYSWTEQQINPALKVFVSIKEGVTSIETLDSKGGYAVNGNAYTVRTTADTDYYYQTSASGVKGHEMMRVPYAIENNPSSLNNAHVNSFFVDYGNGLLGGTSDYETPIKAVDELGGLSVINHPGEYTNARDEETTADAYDYSNVHYKYVIDKFTNLLETYPSCLGIDMNSKGDTRTRYDRKLWDILLMNVVPTGRNVYGLATSDAHSLNAVYTGYTMMILPDCTVENLKNAMANGQFFAASKYLGNPDEIAEYATYLLESADPAANDLGAKLCDLQAANPNAKFEADKAVDAPVVTNISVDDAADVISISADDALCIRWISNGQTIATGNSIDLDDYSEEIGSYVRAEILGEGGIVYTQPFTLKYQGAPKAEKGFFIDLWVLASIIPDTIVRILGELPIFEAIWKWVSAIA